MSISGTRLELSPGFNIKVVIDFFKKVVGDPNQFTVSQMSFFRSFISKVCRKNKVSQGISKKAGTLYEPSDKESDNV